MFRNEIMGFIIILTCLGNVKPQNIKHCFNKKNKRIMEMKMRSKIKHGERQMVLS